MLGFPSTAMRWQLIGMRCPLQYGSIHMSYLSGIGARPKQQPGLDPSLYSEVLQRGSKLVNVRSPPLLPCRGWRTVSGRIVSARQRLSDVYVRLSLSCTSIFIISRCTWY
ncbi:hypothetical protein CONLIGDRAFT_371441 [Coniochaeta ligniaria NRRL 30616]|uniref:Uncharacterized protein n=1 Tax=Coniochaeta ligniaria NRRL 30616 TaxID=1408157 RepID=A0A1J7JKU5_9PEZI|nr:hypothetical protein CONLIGDRAFT_371441 [Coniochaeta ligniaria NRRL 30616]